MDILDHLTEEHRKAAALLDRLPESEAGSERDGIVRELDDALTLHMTVEELFLYPMAGKVVGAEEMKEANNEHDLARQGLMALREYEDEPGFGAAVEMLKGGITHHIHDEESELFPELRARAADQLASMDPEQLEQEARAAIT